MLSEESNNVRFERMWISAKENMKKDEYRYNYSLEEASKHYDILDMILQVFTYYNHEEYSDYILKKDVSLTRVVLEPQCNIDRSTPNEDYRHLNRMNGNDKLYGYYVIDYCRKALKERNMTGNKEMSADNQETISTCEFHSIGDLRLIKCSSEIYSDLKLEPDTILQDCKLIRRSYSIPFGRKGKKKVSAILAYNCFLKIMEVGNVFRIPEETDEDNLCEYAPFLLIADFFERKGYDGILYPSTGNLNEYCIVIFHSSNIIPYSDS